MGTWRKVVITKRIRRTSPGPFLFDELLKSRVLYQICIELDEDSPGSLISDAALVIAATQSKLVDGRFDDAHLYTHVEYGSRCLGRFSERHVSYVRPSKRS